ncbi:hypothetical protein BVX99_00725 [bacterium F16]|nr:hypothetical protein BVX99_00725 [bacterium F16]
MYSCIRYTTVFLVLLALTTACSSTKEYDKYILVVLDQDGAPVQNALVTPKIDGKDFEAKNAGVDGQVDLRGLYSEMPTSILIRASKYKSKRVKWMLPSPVAQTIILEKF